jgi:calcineurin-like phosphoesterase family protein
MSTRKFFTADTHFGHENIITLESRPFRLGIIGIDDHDEELIYRWNNVVKAGDLVYHLGDFSFHGPDETIDILDRLNGQIIFVEGNHDAVLRNARVKAHKRIAKIYQLTTTRIDGQLIRLCHYPLAAWGQTTGTWHFHGHVHGNFDTDTHNIRRLDVGVDAYNNDYFPIEGRELKERIEYKIRRSQYPVAALDLGGLPVVD